ncbi:uncharacterized protein LOC116779967 [Chiroxiphia lanceolata]|uniref:uncharacterized protein LOC116779967 n=1 Tax=Chiroxiphia lanceolata TaxID=296741 RepID=UPI0013CF3CCA|nr:uncharacterized protein LOC116779967 [Chiroxiphia lanceolata]
MPRPRDEKESNLLESGRDEKESTPQESKRDEKESSLPELGRKRTESSLQKSERDREESNSQKPGRDEKEKDKKDKDEIDTENLEDDPEEGTSHSYYTRVAERKVKDKEGGKTYRLVQDLRTVNEITKTLHPVVANPYTLLTKLKDSLIWFTVLDLKDEFFCLTLATESQKIFAFEWESVNKGRKTQLTWTVLPQVYKSSLTLFGNQLAKELEQWEWPQGDGTLLQYVDDLLITTETEEECVKWTISLLNFLGLNGYRVSQQKVQLVQEKVVYLGYEISRGQRSLGTTRKEVICQMPRPETYQAVLAESDDVTIQVTNIVNPTSFLEGRVPAEPIENDCLETIEAVYSSCPDLKEEPFKDTDNCFSDGSSFMKQGVRVVSYAVTTTEQDTFSTRLQNPSEDGTPLGALG